MFLQQPHALLPKILDVAAPLDADDSGAPGFLQHLVPFLIISADPVPVNEYKRKSLQLH